MLGCAWPWFPIPGLVLNPTHTLLPWPGLSPSLSSSSGRGPMPGAGAAPVPPSWPAPGWGGGTGLAGRPLPCCPTGTPRAPIPGEQPTPGARCQLLRAASSPKPAPQSQARGCARPCPTDLAWHWALTRLQHRPLPKLKLLREPLTGGL